MAKEVDGSTTEMAQVATISAQDAEIGELIAEAFDKVGKDGVITVEESNTTGTELEFTEGMQFDKGYISPYFVTDPERMEAVLEDAYILLHQGKISSVADLLPLLEKVVGAGKPLFIVAEDVDGEALSTLVVNKIRGTFNAVAVKAPGFGDRRKAMLQDLAVLTGGQVVAAEVGLKLDQVGLEVLGSARRIVVTKDDTTIVDGGGDKAEVNGRVAQIRAEIERTDSDWDQEKLQERLAKLAGGVCVIKVGAAHRGRAQGEEAPHRGRRLGDRAPRSRRASSPAAAPRWCTRPPSLDGDLGLTGDEATGVAIVRKAARRAAALDRRERRASRATSSSPRSASSASARATTPRPASTATWSPTGVIDPVKVTRSALRNAASIAAMLLTTETLVVEKKEPSEDAAAGHGHGHGH